MCDFEVVFFDELMIGFDLMMFVMIVKFIVLMWDDFFVICVVVIYDLLFVCVVGDWIVFFD